jgi:hypothetical protein
MVTFLMIVMETAKKIISTATNSHDISVSKVMDYKWIARVWFLLRKL